MLSIGWFLISSYQFVFYFLRNNVSVLFLVVSFQFKFQYVWFCHLHDILKINGNSLTKNVSNVGFSFINGLCVFVVFFSEWFTTSYVRFNESIRLIVLAKLTLINFHLFSFISAASVPSSNFIKLKLFD